MDSLVPLILIALVVGVFWVGVYCWLLYLLGRKIAERFRTRPGRIFATITFLAAILAGLAFLIPVDVIWKSMIVFSIWITHTQALGSGFWAGMELGRRSDEVKFKQQTEEWLREWEEPVRKSSRDDAD